MTLADDIGRWIAEHVREAGLSGVVVGLSGGIDSAVVSGLCARGIGAKQVLGVCMPCHSNPRDAEDAALTAETWDIPFTTVDVSGAYDTLVAALPPGSDLAYANIKPRLRMITLYHHANTLGKLVAGTGNRSELLAGYFTKYGDGGVDILPIAGLYKHQVRQLAAEIGVPPRIIARPPSAGLWEGQTDEAELGITYTELDTTLQALDTGDTAAIDPATLEKVQRMIALSAHKRRLAPIYQPPSRANGG